MTVWATFETGQGEERVGTVHGERIHALDPGTSLLALMREGDLETASRSADSSPAAMFTVDEVRLLPPVAHPPSVRDYMAFEQHVEGPYAARGLAVPDLFYETPIFYFTNPRALVGAMDDVPVPPGCTRFDYELEIAAIVGREGSDLTPQEAEDSIAGYCLYIDWSARDLQETEMTMRLGPAKGKDSSTTLGPYLVTPAEIASARCGKAFDLKMQVHVNGELRGEDVWSNIYWSFGEMLSWASRGTVLSVGDVVGSGTCGNGCIKESHHRRGDQGDPWLEPGDVVRMEVEGLGVTENRIVTGRAPVDHRLHR